MNRIALTALAVMMGATVQAKIVTQPVEYAAGSIRCEGFIAYDDSKSGQRPAVIVVHDWKGAGSFVQDKCVRLAELGYVAFAADIYGKGVRPATTEEASAEAGKYYGDRALWRSRVNAALQALLKDPHVDPARVGAMGFCFGGSTVLELARSGAPVAGVVSFHGGLETPTPADAKQIKGKVLALHGAIDPWVPDSQVAGFKKEMEEAGVDWHMISYGGAVHAFTNPAAGNDISKGAAYNANADRRSWAAMKEFWNELFAPTPTAGQEQNAE